MNNENKKLTMTFYKKGVYKGRFLLKSWVYTSKIECCARLVKDSDILQKRFTYGGKLIMRTATYKGI